MEVKLNGSKEDLIGRSEECDYCIFEELLSVEQRKIKVLDLPVPQSHAHRVSIEYACGKNYAGVCLIKYAAMRAFPDDFTACQLGAIKDFIWDLGKRNNTKSGYNEAIPEWTKSQDLGRGIKESYAQRFREIWNLGLRKINNERPSEMRQDLTSPLIYEIVVASPTAYESALTLLRKLTEESRQRDSVGKNK
ncbi:MAG: hypothetical protein JW749_10485 [Sedimentisphaerales bacterium]|nr:hypothetical protein [Sedimentisphaerales bacterium]